MLDFSWDLISAFSVLIIVLSILPDVVLTHFSYFIKSKDVIQYIVSPQLSYLLSYHFVWIYGNTYIYTGIGHIYPVVGLIPSPHVFSIMGLGQSSIFWVIIVSKVISLSNFANSGEKHNTVSGNNAMTSPWREVLIYISYESRGIYSYMYLLSVECKGSLGTAITTKIPKTLKSHWILLVYHIDGLVQERRNSNASAMELRLSCTIPSIFSRKIQADTASP